MGVLKKLIIILFTMFPFVSAHLDYDEYEYIPLEIKCTIDQDILMIFLRETVKRECICKDGVYHCRTIHPVVGYTIFRARVGTWIRENYDPICVKETQEIMIKGWACLCLRKKTWWCTKSGAKSRVPELNPELKSQPE